MTYPKNNSKAAQTKPRLIAARCTPQMKKRLADAERSTGLNESEFVRAALSEFFANHNTPAAVLQAVKNYRAAA